jgi:hypothetical protein
MAGLCPSGSACALLCYTVQEKGFNSSCVLPTEQTEQGFCGLPQLRATVLEQELERVRPNRPNPPFLSATNSLTVLTPLPLHGATPAIFQHVPLMPNRQLSARTFPAEPLPAQPVPAQPVPAQPVSAHPVPAQPVPAHPGGPFPAPED